MAIGVKVIVAVQTESNLVKINEGTARPIIPTQWAETLFSGMLRAVVGIRAGVLTIRRAVIAGDSRVRTTGLPTFVHRFSPLINSANWASCRAFCWRASSRKW